MNAGTVVWFTGLPASGKSTLAAHVAEALRAAGRAVVVLDGDAVREVLVPAPGHDEVGRDGMYRTLAGLAALIAREGPIVLVPATAHRRAWRTHARALAPHFVEVYVATPLAECRRRDPKRLYASSSVAAELPGVGPSYEPPLAPDVVAPDGDDDRALSAVLARLAASSP